MPKYYCDYCDTFLTHDSPSVRKTHNGGRKHKENVRMFYQNWMEQQAQKLVDAHTKAFKQHGMLNPHAPIMPPAMNPMGAHIPMPGRPPIMPQFGMRPPVPPNAFTRPYMMMGIPPPGVVPNPRAYRP